MKRKFLIASHGKLAAGMQNALAILANQGEAFEVINAYVTEEDYTPAIVSFLRDVDEEEQGVILTDLYGGSVNQRIVGEVMVSGKENVFVISNANLAIALTLLFLNEGAELTSEDIQQALNECQVQLVSLDQTSEEEEIF